MKLTCAVLNHKSRDDYGIIIIIIIIIIVQK
jgi:hypothetical protein